MNLYFHKGLIFTIRRTVWITLLFVLIAILFLASRSYAEYLDPQGTDAKNISTCTGLKGHYTSLPGNHAHPMAAFDSAHNYIVNRFTKGQFAQGVGSDNNLYLIWAMPR